MDLITLEQAKQYLQLTDAQTSSDVQIQSFIDGASESFLTITSLPYIALTQFSERRNGSGTGSMTTINRPLQSITSLIINGFSISESPDGINPGFFFPPGGNVIYLAGGYNSSSRYFADIGFGGVPGKFAKGVGNVTIAGTAGYPNRPTTLSATIPAGSGATIQLSSPEFQTMVISAGATVTNQNTAANLTQVTGTPEAGQFAINPDGTLLFATADSGTPVLIQYTQIGIPFDIQQCVYEMVAWAYKEKDRVGITTQKISDNLQNSYARGAYSDRSNKTIQRYTRKDVVVW